MIKAWILPLCMFMSGYNGIVTELALFQLAEALIGSTISNLLYTMGIMMFAMGVGALLAHGKFVKNASIGLFLQLEMILALIVSLSIPAITLICGNTAIISPTLVFILFSFAIGCLIGMEIPIMQKIISIDSGKDIQGIASSVMMADYFGSLMGFVLFTLYLLHSHGIAFSTMSAAFANLISASLILLFYKKQVLSKDKFVVLASAILLGSIAFNLENVMKKAEQMLFEKKIIWSKQTPYQHLVLTDNQQTGNPRYEKLKYQKHMKDLKKVEPSPFGNSAYELLKDRKNNYSLYINGGLQFNTYDEKHYHEFLVHPAMSLNPNAKHVLVLGGGDGLAIRELAHYDSIESITLVDIDKAMMEAFATQPLLREINKNALNDPRLKIVVMDAWKFVRFNEKQYDMAILDFPDPHHSSTAKLYSQQFYQYLKSSLSKEAIIITQSTSPLLDRRAYLCIRKTLQASGFNVLSTHIEMESFFQWGFQLASLHRSENEIKKALENFNSDLNLEYLHRDSLESSWLWSKNFFIEKSPIPVNDFMKLPLLKLYNSNK